MGTQEESSMSLQVTQEEADRLSAALRNERVSAPGGMQKRSVLKLRHLRDIHVKHPEYIQKDLRIITGYSDPMVSKYWKMFVKQEIRTWDEAMK